MDSLGELWRTPAWGRCVAGWRRRCIRYTKAKAGLRLVHAEIGACDPCLDTLNAADALARVAAGA